MAIIRDQITVGDHLVYSLDTDPRTGLGTPAIVGTIAMIDVGDAGTLGEAYLKVGAADTAWRLIATATTAAANVEDGTFRYLAVYKTDASGDVVNDDFVEGGGAVVAVNVEADALRTANILYTVPKQLNTITSAYFVMTEGDQLFINGNKTFQDNVVVEGNLTVNGALTYLNTVNTTITDALVTLNKGGAALSGNGSGIEVEEGGVVTGYWKVGEARAAWCLKAPANAFEACLNTQLLTADQDYNFPDQSGTFLLQPSTPQGVYQQIAWWQDVNTVVSETGVAPNAITWDEVNNFLGVQTATPKSIMHVGNFTTSGAVGTNAILLGQMHATTAIGQGALLAGGIGFPNKAEGLNSLVSGSSSSAQGANSSAMGSSAIASAAAAHAEGTSTTASGSSSHAEGLSTIANAAQAHAEGSSTTASGINAHAEGSNTTASAPQAHAEGDTTIASGVNAHAEGLNSSATFPQAHAEGSSTTASAANAHAEGDSSTASAAAAHAEGKSTQAIAANAHAEGDTTLASGTASHAEGKSTTTSAANAHAEGDSSTASAAAAHAEGKSTTASGINAHAEGELTVASGLDSHAAGLSSVAAGAYSSAQGRKAQTGVNAGAMSLSDSQDFTSTVDSADRMKMRYTNGWDMVKGGGANDDDGVNFKIRQDLVATVNATLTTMQSIAVPTDSTLLIESRIVGVRTGGTAGAAGDTASYVRTATYKNIGGTVTVNKRQSDYTYEDQAGWDVDHAVSGTNAIVEVKGAANNNVRWHVTSKIQIVKAT